jgi:hypothetical protein
MNELQKLLSEQVDWYIVAVTSLIIIVVALLAVFSWLLDCDAVDMFDDEEQPTDKVDDQNDYNHRTG